MIYEIKPQQASSSGRFFHGPISQIYMLKPEPQVAELHILHVEKPQMGLGTVLLLCGCTWAAERGLNYLTGAFTPIGDPEAARNFYRHRGVEVEGGQLAGDILNIIDRCHASLQRNNVGYIFK